MTIKLSPEKEAELIDFAKAGRTAWADGNLIEAEKCFLDAWNLIPEPKADFDYTQSLASGFVDFYRDTRQFDLAKKWLNEMRNTYGANDVHYEFQKASVHFEANEMNEAFAIFDSLYKRFKRRPFSGKKKEYLDFYLSRVRS